jgi:superfamily II DNA/RNA helicase
MSEYTSNSYQSYLDLLDIPAFNPMQLDFFSKTNLHKDLILLAPTGTGKTLAYMIPLVETLLKSGSGIRGLILLPSRELAIQTEQVFKSLKTTLKVSTCYGGHDAKTERQSLSGNPDVVIGTPGRIADHLKRGAMELKRLEIVVLDEFDKALQYGFHTQISQIFEVMGNDQRHWFTSATNLRTIPEFIPVSSPKIINFLSMAKESQLELKVLKTSTKEKAISLTMLLSTLQDGASLVFCNHRESVVRISQLLAEEGFTFSMLHGAMEQLDRERNLIKFRSGINNIMVATDLAARGLDIPEIRYVIHYQLPPKPDGYIHRNGRTARMQATGESYLVLSDEDILPDYIDEELAEITLPEELVAPLPNQWAALYISMGKKDKISKGDIVGLLTKKGNLKASEIGLITIMDRASYVAIKAPLVEKTLQMIKSEKLKNNKVKIEVAK